MSRTFAAIALIVAILIGGGIVATTAYQAGVSTAVTQAAADGATVVNPVVVPGYGFGWGWGPGIGFGFFGFLFTLFFLFIVFGLIRALIWGGRGRGHRGHWGGPGWDPEDRRTHFESRFHGTFDDWHRQAHDAPATPPTSNTPPSTPPTG
jgi:hypothetical protein